MRNMIRRICANDGQNSVNIYAKFGNYAMNHVECDVQMWLWMNSHNSKNHFVTLLGFNSVFLICSFDNPKNSIVLRKIANSSKQTNKK